MKRMAILAIAIASLSPAMASAQVAPAAAVAPAPAPAPAPEAQPAAFMFTSSLSPVYRLERVRLLVDGAVFYEGNSPFVTSIPPGQHALELIADYRLEDRVLTYMRGYTMELRSNFVAKPIMGQALVVQATAVPAGDVTTPIERRATIVWRDLPP